MKKKMTALLAAALIVILSCTPVMAAAVSAAPEAEAATSTTVTAKASSTGWRKSGSNWTYYVKGKKQTNCILKIGKFYYGFDSSGYLQKGLFKINGSTYCGSVKTGPNATIKYGALLMGYHKVGTAYYYFDPALNGRMLRGLAYVGKKLMYFDTKTGKQYRKAGTLTVNGNIYKVAADGSLTFVKKAPADAVGPDSYGMDAKASKYSSNTRYLILVNKSKYAINVYKGSKGNWTCVRREIPCTIGKRSTPSPSGRFYMSHKSHRGAYGYKDFGGSTVFYTCGISAGNYLHSILYKKGSRNPYTAKIKDGSLKKSKSNSCIRLPLEDIKYIYQNVPTKSAIVVY